MTVSLVLTEPPVVMMTKMFHYITATALTTTVAKIAKVRHCRGNLFFFVRARNGSRKASIWYFIGRSTTIFKLTKL